MDKLDVHRRDPLAQEIDEVELAVVLRRPADVEDLAVDDFERRLERRDDRSRSVANVNVRAPELLAEDDEVTGQTDISRELIDCEVEAHPRRRAVDGREAQAGRLQTVGAARKDVHLRCDLRLRVERHGPQLEILRRVDGAVRHLAVVAACRRKDEAGDAGLGGVV